MRKTALFPTVALVSLMAASPASAAVTVKHQCLYATMTYDDVTRTYHVWGTNPSSGKVVDMTTTEITKAYYTYFIVLKGKF